MANASPPEETGVSTEERGSERRQHDVDRSMRVSALATSYVN